MDSMEEEEDTMISTILTEIEETLNNHHPSQPPPPLSLSTLQNLQSLLNNNPNLHDHLFKSLSPSTHLLPSLTSTMDSSHTLLSLHSSNTYLSLLLLPESPIFTLFTPISFLSLLRSLRRSLKVRKTGTDSGNWDSGSGVRGKRRKGKALKGNVEMSRSGDNDCFDGGLFMSVVEKLGFVLDLIHLNRFPDSLKSLVSTVAEIPVLAMEFNGSNGVSLGRLWELCSGIFRKTLKLEHGEEGETAVEILKALSPLILMGKSQARSFALGFVRNSMLGLSDVVRKAVVNLPRYLVHKAPEKAEPRAMAVEAIVEIVRGLDFEDRIGFVEFVVKISQGKADLRILGIDLSLNLVMSLKDPFGFELDHESEHSWGFKCLEALIQRCSDVNAVIRARALSNLSQLVSFLSNDVRYREVLKRMLGYGEMERTESEKRFNLLLRKRCTDEKANVRRAALVLINKLTSLSSGNIDQVILKAMGVACSDPLVSIRKAAILALSEAFRTFSSVNVTTEWLHSVPRLITDNESSIQAECENLFLELVLDRITLVGSSRRSQDEKSRGKEKDEVSFRDGIATLLKEICNGEVAPWVKKICTNLGKQKRLKPKVAGALQNIIRTSELLWLNQSLPIENWTAPPGAWFLLSEVSGYLSEAVDWEFLEHHWQLLDTTRGVSEFNGHSAYEYGENSVDSNSFSWAGDRVFLLQTISNVSVDLPPEPAADLAHKLLIGIEEFKMHLTEVNAHVKALRTLCKQKASNPGEADGLVVKWVKQVLSKALRILEKYISEVSEENKENNFFTTPQTSGRKSKKRQATLSRMLSQAVVAVYTIGSLVIVCPSADMSEIVPVMHRIITSGNSDLKLSKLPASSVSIKAAAPPLYIQAWLTMGKICLADGKVAKSYIPLFVQELEKSESAALRNNLVVIMADFCVRYTALVDCYISKITKCLCDPCELVRRQTFILLSRLLQRDYVKWRGVLFLRFLLSLVDESEKIRQLADFLFGNILRVKAPLLAYNSFVEAVFVLNDCNTHNGHNGSKMSKAENRLFSIRGSDESSRSKRMHIYTSLLKQMAPEHLLATFAKLCAEILASASDGILNIDDVTGKSVLQDTFEILASKEMRIQAGRGSQNDAGDIDVEGSEGDLSAAAAAKGRAITQAVRKGLIQNTIPVFIELKWLLESKNSSLTGSLMECLRVLLKDYKNEIDEMLVADKQLQKELIYDMQKYESNKVKSTAAATMQNPNSFHSPMNPKNDKSTENLQSNRRVASAIADAAAAATARSVLREWNKGGLTPPLSSIKLPRLNKSSKGVNHPELQSARPLEVLESLRRQCFMPDDEH